LTVDGKGNGRERAEGFARHFPQGSGIVIFRTTDLFVDSGGSRRAKDNQSGSSVDDSIERTDGSRATDLDIADGNTPVSLYEKKKLCVSVNTLGCTEPDLRVWWSLTDSVPLVSKET